ncbi:MAG: phenylacetate--CoA ligase family protein [Candidatus Eisenbacteria bacterium]|nr:phenylacetate--CoA ligase family protein [Candidatus Eisenbacteria bacterium]
MDLFAVLARKALYPAFVGLKRETHLCHLREMERTQYLPKDKLETLQFERLRRLVAHAAAHCPYYARSFADCGVGPSSLKELGDIRKFPVLRKKDIQANAADMLASNVPRSHLVENRTGGSTGKPLHFYVDLERMETRKAATIRHNRWAGYDIADRAGIVWGSTRDLAAVFEGRLPLRNAVFERSLVLDASSLTEQGMLDFADRLAKYKPRVILAYAHSAYLFASVLESRATRTVSPHSVITTAEMLYPHQRERIERVFGCRVFDRYGSRETSVIASECEAHSGLHINAECLLLETLEDGRPVGPGEPGEVIITDLLNVGMPFIRYAIEDWATLSPDACACGRTLPLMSAVEGRTTDFIRTPEGKYVSGAALTIKLIAEIPGIAQAQLIQDSIDSVRFRIVKDPSFTKESEELLLRKARELMGPSISISTEFCENIPSEPSGKFRFSISKATGNEKRG